MTIETRASDMVKQTFYVDDCLTGAATVEEAISLSESLNQLLEKACMKLRKWRLNSEELLQTIPEQMREEHIQSISAPERCHKTLGYSLRTRSMLPHEYFEMMISQLNTKSPLI